MSGLFGAAEGLDPFPTPIVRLQVRDHATFRRVLAPLLVRASQTLPSVARGERSGWQSDADLLQWGPLTSGLTELFGEAVRAWGRWPSPGPVDLSAWANVFERGTYFTPHRHGMAAVSGVYHLEVPGPEEAGGWLCFADPRAGAGMVRSALTAPGEGAVLALPPRAGELVVFPAWLQHWVTPWAGDLPRISIAFSAV